MNLLGNARYSPHSLVTLLRLKATQGGNLKTLKMKMKHSTNIMIISGVDSYAKLGGKLEYE
jgi:hypothetical protein